ncbi:hypothetical protein [Metallosphaera cuprina]|uniref:Uncharacterized protein n=1 Tax=Metallosphaera cuprina (strain Ar-4) TaxID=1006006 RepID=F4G2W9_METCR|nr:hypothetical protein [Metallosphaera cuprina]AEB95167.1 hypothetical protein Mcup_1062 [Metallosphaera cuprina Ar-4]
MASKNRKAVKRRDAPAKQGNWSSGLHEAAKSNSYAKGVAEFLGIDPEIVKDSYPVRNWKEFAEKADEEAYRRRRDGNYSKRWLEAYRAAYTTPEKEEKQLSN